jgi:hypothetical protein
VEGLLIVASWADHFRNDLGLEGVSQVWGLRPSWYFWICGSPGVYHLELMDTAAGDHSDSTFYKARFMIKCYPFLAHSYYSRYSLLEQALAKSRYFDSTRSPVYETREHIPQDLYNVGILELTMDEENLQANFVFETFDILRSVYVQKTERSYPELNFRHCFNAGEIDRNLPALKIGYPLFDCMVCLYSYARKNHPHQVRLSRFQGYEFALEKDDVRLSPSADIHGYRLQVSYFCAPNDKILGMVNGLPPDSRKDLSVIYNRSFECNHFQPTPEEKKLPTPLNAKWWALAETDYSSNLTSTCGCH